MARATNADMVSWGAVLYDPAEDHLYPGPLRQDIPIRDRTGGGDSFASGVLAALLKGKDLQTAVEWGERPRHPRAGDAGRHHHGGRAAR